MKLHKLNLFVPITRQAKTPDGLLVEGYTYVNAECGDGITLTRSAMEEASDDYMRWGAIREMHQPKAAGTAQSVEFDEKGAFLRALIVDSDAIEKCEKGVYKGFSVGIRPKVMRGKEVSSCSWIENSLVDRPMDPDAAFRIARADSVDEAEEFEVDIEDLEPPTVQRHAFAEYVKDFEANALKSAAFDWLWSALYDIQATESDMDKGEEVKAVCAEFGEYFAELVEAGGLEAEEPEEVENSDLPDMTRLEDTTISRADYDALQTRMEAAERERAEAAAELEPLRSRIAELEAMPATVKPVVKHSQAVDRTFLANHVPGGDANGSVVAALRSEYDQIVSRLKTETDERTKSAGVHRMLVLKSQLHELGARL